MSQMVQDQLQIVSVNCLLVPIIFVICLVESSHDHGKPAISVILKGLAWNEESLIICV